MSLALLFVGGSTLAVAAAYMMTSRSAIHAALAAPTAGGQNTAVGLTDPGAETLAGGSRSRPRTEWHLTTVDNLTAAEELLDCLENQGFTERELVVLGNSAFAVRWR
jgi:hypothetical protein